MYEKIIMFFFNKFKGLIFSIAYVFPSLPHVYYLQNLKANFYTMWACISNPLMDDYMSLFKRISFAYLGEI